MKKIFTILFMLFAIQAQAQLAHYIYTDSLTYFIGATGDTLAIMEINTTITDNHVLTYDSATNTFAFEAAPGAGGGSGTMTTVKEGGSQVGGSDIVTLDFGAGFDIAESPDTEINITLDFTEVSGHDDFTDFVAAEHIASSGAETYTNKTLDSFTNDIIADGLHVQVRNVSGSGFTKGDVIHIDDYNIGQDLPEAVLADADVPSVMPAFGIVAETIANNANGAVCIAGRMSTLNTSGIAAGDSFYVSTTAGAFTGTRPVGATSKIQRLGVVLRSHATLGVVEISGAGRSNDLPNIASANFWLGNGSGVATAVTMSSGATMDNTGALTVANNHITSARVLDNDLLFSDFKTIHDDATGLYHDSNSNQSKSVTEDYLNNPSTSAEIASQISDEIGTGFLVLQTDPVFLGTSIDIGGGASAAELRLLEPSGGGTSYTGWKSPALAANIMYTMPTVLGSAGFQLTDAAGDGILSWAATAPAADLTTPGIIEIATGAETNTGTDATRAVSPDGLDDWTGSAQVTTLGTVATGVWNGTAVTYANLNFSNNIVAGDIATGAVETTEILDNTVAVEDVQPELDNQTLSYSIIDTVKAADLFRIHEFNYPITIDSVVTNTDAGTHTFNVEHRAHTDPRSAGTDILTADIVADAYEANSTFDDATIPANRPLYHVGSAVSGGADRCDVTIFYKID